jgi:phosphoribosylanthranilate isomerase
VKIKICGICTADDAQYAAQAGADYIGVILAQRGPRARSLAEADAIFANLEGVQRVGVFADQTVSEVVAASERLALDVLQLHGRESAEFIDELRRGTACRIWKAVALEAPADLERARDVYGDVVHGLLLDSPRGGSGTTFDWELARDARRILPPELQFIVAGGLNPANVQRAVATLSPDVVDVSSGVEENICLKSKERVDEFIRSALR